MEKVILHSNDWVTSHLGNGLSIALRALAHSWTSYNLQVTVYISDCQFPDFLGRRPIVLVVAMNCPVALRSERHVV